MKIGEAIQVFGWQDFWTAVTSELASSHTSPRRRQEIWVMLRYKLMTEAQSFGEPYTETLRRFRQLLKAVTKYQPRKQQAPEVLDEATKKLEALVTIYQFLVKLSKSAL